MCTPESFLPIPSSPPIVITRGTQFDDDVLFRARDQLRVEGAMGGADVRTRAMVKALQERIRLAIFNHQNGGIHLTCGQYCATKASNALYRGVRSMLPTPHYCPVYFEMNVLPPPPISTNDNPKLTLLDACASSVALFSDCINNSRYATAHSGGSLRIERRSMYTRINHGM